MKFANMRSRGILALLVLAPWLQPESTEAQIQTIVTDHFRIHYMGGASGTARRVADVSEEVFASLAAAYNYYDEFSPIHVIVIDSSDMLGNGSADYYANTIFIWATHLDSDLRGSHDWIKNVFTHELAHIMTLNMARKKWPFQFALLSVSRFDSNPDISFSLPLYHMNAPRWWSEGVAQFATNRLGYEDWDTHRDMLLRMAVLEDDLLSYEEMGTVQNRTGANYGEMVYNQGYALLTYISELYGPEKVEELTHHTGHLSFDPAIRSVLGISADQLYDDWKDFLKEQYSQQAEEVRGNTFFEGKALRPLNEGIREYYPAFSPDGKKLAYLSSEDWDYAITFLKIYDLKTGKKQTVRRNKRFGDFAADWVHTRSSWSPDGNELVYVRSNGGFNDLYVYDLSNKRERRISANLRAKDPQFSPDGEKIVFVRNEDGTNNLGLINSDGTGLKYLTNNNDATQYWGPQWSPDGKWLLFSIFRGEDRDIAMIRADSPPKPDKKTKRRARLTTVDRTDSLEVFPDTLAFPDPDTSGFRPMVASRFDERDPSWLTDGSGFVYSSDQTGIFNIYRYTMETGEVEQLTNVLGGAFTPTVSPDGKVVYASYHASNHDLFEFELGEYQRSQPLEFVAQRDFQSIFQGAELSDPFQAEYEIQRYGGRKTYRLIPLLNVGPTFVGDTFGLNQVSGGAWFSTGEMFGGQQFVARLTAGKNLREDTDFNTDLVLFAQRSLRPMVGNNRTFNPSFYAMYRRLEIDNLIKGNTVANDTIPVSTIFTPVDSTRSLLIPDVRQYVNELDSREDLFKSTYEQVALGIDVPLTRRQRLSFQYFRRDYRENWDLRRFRVQQQIFVVQDGVDITDQVDDIPLEQDTLLVDANSSQSFYDGLDFFSAHDISIGWTYQNWKPTADQAFYRQGREFSFLYRYSAPTVADSIAQQTSTNGVPLDAFGPAKKRFRVNEYVGMYSERIGLPFGNAVGFQMLGAYRNVKLKPGFIPDGGLFEGRFYWPLRYYLGGLNLMSGYPYFSQSGSKLMYGKVEYTFPLVSRLNLRFMNFTFAKLYGRLFAEVGAVGNFDKFRLGDFDGDDVIRDIGGEVRMQMFTFYRIPMFAFFQVARPLDRNQFADDGSIDKYRYYFGFNL